MRWTCSGLLAALRSDGRNKWPMHRVRELATSSMGKKGNRRKGGHAGGRSSADGGGAVGRRTVKGGSSGMWMKRHLQDPYVSAALETGAPSRAAFKLVEMNDRHRIISPGDRVVDLGAAPGGWSMIAARIVHGKGRRIPPGVGRTDKVARGRRGGAPPQLPLPIPEAPSDGAGGVASSGRRPRSKTEIARRGALVAVDLLDMNALPGVKVVRGDFRDTRVEAEVFASLADQGDTPPAGSPPGRVASPTLPSGELQTNDGKALDDHFSRDRDAFLRRGTSSSNLLLPRPVAPSKDLFECLLQAEVSRPNPSSTIRGEAQQDSREREKSSLSGGREKSPGKTIVSRAPERNHAGVPLNVRGEDSAVTAARKRRATVVLSDMAPAFSGDHGTDQARVASLVLDALAACLGNEGRRTGTLERAGCGPSRSARESDNLVDSRFFGAADELTGNEASEEGMGATTGSGVSIGLLARGGTFLGKFFAGRDEREVKGEAERLFQTVKVVKPPASRSGSSEMYILATGFLLGQKKS